MIRSRFFVIALSCALAVFGIFGCSSGSQGASASSTESSTASAAVSSSASAAASSSASASASSSAASASSAAATQKGVDLPVGEYTATFKTDSKMFHVNEANDNKGVLTVTEDGATIHVSLVSKKIVNLYYGLADDAKKDGAQLIQPTTDTVTYSDGMSEEVYGFDIPVPAIGEEFDVAILGESGKWFDHKVSVSDPVAQ